MVTFWTGASSCSGSGRFPFELKEVSAKGKSSKVGDEWRGELKGDSVGEPMDESVGEVSGDKVLREWTGDRNNGVGRG